MINKRKQGTEYEDAAASFLEKKGYKIIDRNFFCKFGEIDIIAIDNQYIVFIEVKYRKSNSYGSAKSAVTIKKMKTICRVADYYMLSHHMNEERCVRFDVIAIEAGHLEHVENAFGYIQ